MKRKLFEIFKIIIGICTIALLPSGNSLPFHHKYCRTDSDCNGANFYCYESRECVECTNCSVYNRHMNPNTKCAKNKDECGKCISGMEAEDNFGGTFTCKPISNQIPTFFPNSEPPAIITTTTTTTTEKNQIEFYAAIFTPILVCIACFLFALKYKLWPVFKQILHPINYPNCPTNPPPPYSEKSPTAPPEEDLLIERRIINDDSQCTIPFHPPNNVRGGSLPVNQYIPPTNPDVPETDDDDENTQPSTWSPSPQNSSDLSNQPTSFSNVLSTTNPDAHAHDHFEQPPNQNSNSDSSNQPNSQQQFNFYFGLISSNVNNTHIINET